MKLLIVAATWNEIKPLEKYLLTKDGERLFAHHAIELLVTGPGSMLTAFRLGKMLPADNWDLAINIGICGSFTWDIVTGTSVNVISDTLADLGAEDDYNFLTAFELDLLKTDDFPFQNGWIRNSLQGKYKAIESLPEVKGITVNAVSGNEFTIARRIAQFHPDVESMEGAAFMYCCHLESIPFIQIRTISNYIGKRDKKSWDLPLAIENLNTVAISLIEEVLEEKS